MNNLLYRRQFILSNKEINIDQSWKKIKLSKINPVFFLQVHPDLEITRVDRDSIQVILLGYVIDPYQPKLSTEDIVKELAGLPDYDSLLRKTDTLSGRYAIIYCDGTSVKLCHDATGFREIYYYSDKQIMVCGSTSKIIADLFEIPRDNDPEVIKFFESEVFNRVGRRWIGTRTVYKNIFHLLPNHYLDLFSGKTHRFWPIAERKEVGLQEASQTIAEILTGTFDAATRRYKLYQGLTGGWDTRLLLSASRNYMDKIHFYFIRGMKSDSSLGNSPDYVISKSIAEKFGFPIEIVMIENETIDEEFKKIYYQNNALSRPSLLPVYYDFSVRKLDDTITVAGSGSNETLRLLSTIHRNASTGKALAGEMGYTEFSYVVDSINEWLTETLPLKSKNHRIMDLFSWEQHFGNWGSLSGSEQDIVREELRPFNNRKLIAIYNSLPDRYRYKDYPKGHVATIKMLWKELLNFDLDMKLPGVKRCLRFFGLEQTADKILQHVKTLK